MARAQADALSKVEQANLKKGVVSFRPGDTVRVHAKIIEGQRERVQVFEGVVIRKRGTGVATTFTVRKVSFNVGVERTFLLNSPRIEKIEVAAVGSVRRARLYYLRELRGKAARIRSELVTAEAATADTSAEVSSDPGAAADAKSSDAKSVATAQEQAAS